MKNNTDSDETADSKKYRVLVIEDHDDTRLLLEMMIKAEGYESFSAASAEEALTAVESFTPDIILSDISLPRIDGHELLKTLRTMPGLESVPAIALTGLADQLEKSLIVESGFEACLIKPINYDLLFEKIDSLIT